MKSSLLSLHQTQVLPSVSLDISANCSDMIAFLTRNPSRVCQRLVFLRTDKRDCRFLPIFWTDMSTDQRTAINPVVLVRMNGRRSFFRIPPMAKNGIPRHYSLSRGE
jgi:hypothetical protein